MSKHYELLRDSPFFSKVQSHVVQRAICWSLRESEPLKVSTTDSWIPPWFVMQRHGQLVIGYGIVNDASGREVLRYIVERSPLGINDFAIRSMYRDGDGFPVKSDYLILHDGISLYQALRVIKRLRKELGSSYVFDVVTSDFANTTPKK